MTDNQNWLAEYVQTGSDAAFRELVSRYVDLVYSTALRLVGGDAHRAEDVAQTVFVNLARVARTLPKEVKLGGWLHRDTCFAASTLMRGERRRQSRERQAVEMNALQNNSASDYSLVAPVLDEAINELGEADRTAVLLRFFEQQDFRSVGQALGSNEAAARMRVTRALEKLEGFLKRRGVTTTASSLGVVLSANAVQAAPAGLALTVSTAVVLTGTTLAITATLTATKAISMTLMQKTIVGATLVAAVGTGVYEARQAATFHAQVRTLQQQQAPLTEQIQQLRQERDEATSRVAHLTSEVERLNQGASEVIKLRGEVARLRNVPATQASQKAGRTGISQSESATGNVSQLTQEATQLWQSGRYAEAISKFESALKVDPNNSIAWNGLGWASFNSGKPAEAEQAFQKVIELEPEHPAALNGLGQLYLSQRKYAEAEPYLLKASPTASAAWFGLARLYLLQDKFEEAEKWAQAIDDSGQGSEFSRAMLRAAKDKKVSNALRLGIEPK